MSSKLLKAALVAAVVLPAGNAIAQGLAPMVGVSTIQGTQQGISMPAYTGVLDKARNTVNTATTQQAAAGSGSSPGPSSAPLAGSSAQNMAIGAPSGASINGQAIPLCSHGGLCQGAMMRAIGRP
ncbi:hypothetical protein KQ298_03200 [Synechococcus sp. CS-1330]|nr:hypothetical protein [Synechococcus sp. CS-1330]